MREKNLEFKLNYYYYKYRDYYFINSEYFRYMFIKREKYRFCLLNELIIMINKYQIKKYGYSLHIEKE